MKKRMNEEQYIEFKATFRTLKKAGKHVSQIRDILGIGNGTAQYIDKSNTFAEYCQLRDEVLARSTQVRQRAEQKLRDKAVEAAQSAVEETMTMPTPAQPKTESTQLRELKKYLDGPFADAIVARIVTALSHEEVAVGNERRTLFGARRRD